MRPTLAGLRLAARALGIVLGLAGLALIAAYGLYEAWCAWPVGP